MVKYFVDISVFLSFLQDKNMAAKIYKNVGGYFLRANAVNFFTKI